MTQSFTIAKADQVITFEALASKTYGDADFSVSATASSGLAVGFSASGDCTVSGSTVHITGAGSCSVAASQAGNENYNAAQDVTQSFTIAKADQVITFEALASKTYGDADFSVSATASSGLAVGFSASGDCTVSGSTVHITGAGSCSVTASQAGNENYNAAPDMERSFSIAKASLTVTAEDKSKTFGQSDPSFTVSYSAFVGSDNAGSLGGPLVFNFAGKPPTSYGPSTTVPTDAGSMRSGRAA